MGNRVTPSLVISVSAVKLKKGVIDSSKVRNGTLLRDDFVPGQINGGTWLAERVSAPLFDVTNSFQPVVTTPVLPAGSYVLSGRANVIGSLVASFLICSLETDAAQNFTVASNAVFPLSMSSVAVLSEPRTISMQCQRARVHPRSPRLTSWPPA